MGMQTYRRRSGWAGAGMLSALLLLTLLAPHLSPADPDKLPRSEQLRLLRPSAVHWFGTDQFGRDVFSRVLHGGRISLLIGLGVAFAAAGIGVVYGTMAGNVGGAVESVMMRLVDLFLAFPVIFLVVTGIALFGRHLPALVSILILAGWMDIARLVRAEVKSLRKQPFLLRARASGLGPARLFARYLFPALVPTLAAAMVLRVADVILIESALSFLGIGVQPPTATWGTILNDATPYLATAWWLALFPALMLIITALSLHLIGESLQATVTY